MKSARRAIARVIAAHLGGKEQGHYSIPRFWGGDGRDRDRKERGHHSIPRFVMHLDDNMRVTMKDRSCMRKAI
jgi:hypothetical protein